MEIRRLLSAVVYTVQTNSDMVPSSVIPISANSYSANTLRAAVDSANSQPFPVVIQFNTSKFTGGAANTITLTSGLTLGPVSPAAAHSYKIVGPSGHAVTISGAGTYTDFTVPAGISAEFDDLTIANGSGTNGGGINSAGQLTLVGDTFASDTATSGGGVYSSNGLITVSHSSFISDSAQQGGGAYVQDGYPDANPQFIDDTFTNDTAVTNGGAIANFLTPSGLTATLTVSGSKFNGDGAQGAGGAIYNLDSVNDKLTASIDGSSFSSDSAEGDGGAVYSDNGKSLSMSSDTFTGDKSIANFGGAVYGGDAALSILNSTLSGDQSFDDGGAVYFQSDGTPNSTSLTVTGSTFTNNKSLNDDGGALDNANTNTVTNICSSTFTGNSALQFGGAIYSGSADGSLTLKDDTISHNSSLNQGGGVYSADGALTVTGGTFDSDTSPDQAGGAIYQTGAGSVSVDGSSFTNDVSFGEGGALNLEDDAADITVTDSKFSHDSTTNVEDGGAIYDQSTSLTVSGSSFTYDDSTDQGGGIYNDSGTLTVSKSTFSNNTASGGGGGIFDDSADITTITGSTFTDNQVPEDTANGGALDSNAATLYLTGDTFTGNSATVFGGAVYFDGGTVQAAQDTFANNSASESGGAIFNDGTVSVSNIFDSTFNGNSTSFNPGDGGAIDEQSATVAYANDTFNGNSAGADGGAIYINSTGTVSITDSTIAGNSAFFADGGGIYSDAGNITLDGTIVAKNHVTGASSTQTDLAGSNGFNTASTDNIIGDGLNAVGFSYGNVGGNFVGTDFMPIDPLLGALANNGGPTETMKPSSKSLAIGNNSNFIVDDLLANDVTGVDQRGVLRPQSQGYDIGAYQTIPATKPDHFVFVNVPSSATKGSAFHAEVEVFTASGSLDHGFIDSVKLSSSDSKAGLSTTSLDFINGVATFSATFNTTGSQTLKVTDTSVGSLVSSLTSSKVNVNAAQKLPTVQIQATSAVHVPSTGTTFLKVPVIFSATATSAITLTYETIGGTASSKNGDYTGVQTATVTIPAGSKAGTYYITIQNIKYVSTKGAYPKTFQVKLVSAKNATITGSSTITVTLDHP